jgi:hypothetical protein
MAPNNPEQPAIPGAPSAPSKVWVVMGTSGEWSDRVEWPLFAFSTEREAQLYADRAPRIYADASEGTMFFVNEVDYFHGEQ